MEIIFTCTYLNNQRLFSKPIVQHIRYKLTKHFYFFFPFDGVFVFDFSFGDLLLGVFLPRPGDGVFLFLLTSLVLSTGGWSMNFCRYCSRRICIACRFSSSFACKINASILPNMLY